MRGRRHDDPAGHQPRHPRGVLLRPEPRLRPAPGADDARGAASRARRVGDRAHHRHRRRRPGPLRRRLDRVARGPRFADPGPVAITPLSRAQASRLTVICRSPKETVSPSTRVAGLPAARGLRHALTDQHRPVGRATVHHDQRHRRWPDRTGRGSWRPTCRPRSGARGGAPARPSAAPGRRPTSARPSTTNVSPLSKVTRQRGPPGDRRARHGHRPAVARQAGARVGDGRERCGGWAGDGGARSGLAAATGRGRGRRGDGVGRTRCWRSAVGTGVRRIDCSGLVRARGSRERRPAAPGSAASPSG